MLNEKVLLYLNRMSKTDKQSSNINFILNGFIKFFPFQRVSFFSYSPFNKVIHGILQIDNGQVSSMESICGKVLNIPLINKAIQHNKPQYIYFKDEDEMVFPGCYIEKYNLTSLFIIPVSISNTVLGVVFIDRFTGKYLFNLQEMKGYFDTAVEAMLLNSKYKQQVLSKRELQTLKPLSNGYSTKEIAAMFNISEFTVRDYISTVMRKLGAKNRTEAVSIAIRSGIIE